MTKLEEIIGYSFRNAALLRQALTHSSYTNEHYLQKLDSNERLEFLGDAVLEVTSTEYLYREFPDDPEGKLSKLRAAMVCEPSLAAVARELELGELLLLGRGEKLAGGHERDSILSDALEALIGALFLDGGMEAAQGFIRGYVLSRLIKKQYFDDYKTRLQEIAQARGAKKLEYVLVGEEGPEHRKLFSVEAMIDGVFYGRGSGHSKKAAEMAAAQEACRRLEETEEHVCT